ncbi:putative fibroblast growth factor [Dirofilaria immitis]
MAQFYESNKALIKEKDAYACVVNIDNEEQYAEFRNLPRKLHLVPSRNWRTITTKATLFLESSPHIFCKLSSLYCSNVIFPPSVLW